MNLRGIRWGRKCDIVKLNMDESGMQFFWTGVMFWSFLGAIVSALIMHGKTKDQGKIFIYALLGFFLGIFGIFLALAARTTPEKLAVIQENCGVKKCPFCAEEIKSEAIKCKHCGTMLTYTNS